MKININSHEELKKLLEALAQEIIDANICHRLYRNLIDSIKENAKAFRESNTFWNFVFISLDEARVIRLCRVFDQESNSLNLYNLLVTIKDNVKYFEEEYFRDRVKENPFVELLAKDNRIPNTEQLEKDIWYASRNNQLVKTLLLWRHNIVAHIGAKVSLGKDAILKDNPLGNDTIEKLLDESFIIFNRYSSLFDAVAYSRQVVGHDDYKSLFKFINLGFEKWNEDINEQLEKIKAEQQH